MDFKIKLSFTDKPSKTIEIKNKKYNSDAISEALMYINGYESKELIGINIVYIGKEVDITY